MLKLTNDDKNIIDTSFKSLLENLKQEIIKENITSALDCSKKLLQLLQNGHFSKEQKIVFSEEFDYIYLPNLTSDGMHVMYGVCCCRHASSLIHEILKTLEFNSTLTHFFIDEKNNWHRLQGPKGANHLALILEENDSQYLINPMNNFISKIEDDLSLTKVEIEPIEQKEYKNHNIDTIQKTLSKYYHLRKLGVTHIYEYE